MPFPATAVSQCVRLALCGSVLSAFVGTLGWGCAPTGGGSGAGAKISRSVDIKAKKDVLATFGQQNRKLKDLFLYENLNVLRSASNGFMGWADASHGPASRASLMLTAVRDGNNDTWNVGGFATVYLKQGNVERLTHWVGTDASSPWQATNQTPQRASLCTQGKTSVLASLGESVETSATVAATKLLWNKCGADMRLKAACIGLGTSLKYLLHIAGQRTARAVSIRECTDAVATRHCMTNEISWRPANSEENDRAGETKVIYAFDFDQRKKQSNLNVFAFSEDKIIEHWLNETVEVNDINNFVAHSKKSTVSVAGKSGSLYVNHRYKDIDIVEEAMICLGESNR
ncbi:MAG: hypothetical protein ACPGUV_01525 [Polyangiales bacterium]